MKSLMVTTSWDDNSHENLKLADLLHQYGVMGTFYVCAETDNFGNLFDRNETMKLHDMGFEIGSHGTVHLDLTRTDYEGLKREILSSKKTLEAQLNSKIHCFGYPYGRFNEETKKVLRSVGYNFARTARHTYLSLPEDTYECPVTMHASNHSPLQSAKLTFSSGISPLSLFDWKKRALATFKKGIEKGGIWHLYGHSWELEKFHYWQSLEQVLRLVSGRNDVLYLSNFDAWTSISDKQQRFIEKT